MRTLLLCLFLLSQFHNYLLPETKLETKKHNSNAFVKATKAVEDLLKKNPSHRQEILSVFCSLLGYTLIGEKPVSFEESGVDHNIALILEEFFSTSREYLFKISCDGEEVCLIHKKKFLEVSKKHAIISLFLAKNHLSARNFLKKFQSSPLSFSEFCNNDGAVLGTFLGFGEQNSIFWARWARLGFFLGTWPFKQPAPHPSPETIILQLPAIRVPRMLRPPKENPAFQSLFSEWRWLRSRQRQFDEFVPPSRIALPTFFYWEGCDTPLHRFIQARNILGQLLDEACSEESVIHTKTDT